MCVALQTQTVFGYKMTNWIGQPCNNVTSCNAYVCQKKIEKNTCKGSSKYHVTRTLRATTKKTKTKKPTTEKPTTETPTTKKTTTKKPNYTTTNTTATTKNSAGNVNFKLCLLIGVLNIFLVMT